MVLIGVAWCRHGSPRDVSVTRATAAATGPEFALSLFKRVCVVSAHFHRVEVDGFFD